MMIQFDVRICFKWVRFNHHLDRVDDGSGQISMDFVREVSPKILQISSDQATVISFIRHSFLGGFSRG